MESYCSLCTFKVPLYLAQTLVLWIVFCRTLFVFLPFSFDHDIGYPSLISGCSDYHFSVFVQLLYSLSLFDLQLTPLISSEFSDDQDKKKHFHDSMQWGQNGKIREAIIYAVNINNLICNSIDIKYRLLFITYSTKN
jgi:hypothetical protein